jgi:excisionase family DNA binding protein
MTTQAAAELLGCSRPLLEEGQISFTKAGKHRRVKYEDVVTYNQKNNISAFDSMEPSCFITPLSRELP